MMFVVDDADDDNDVVVFVVGGGGVVAQNVYLRKKSDIYPRETYVDTNLCRRSCNLVEQYKLSATIKVIKSVISRHKMRTNYYLSHFIALYIDR